MLVEFYNDFVRVDGSIITVGLVEKPIKGHANKELVKKIGKAF